MRMQCENTEEWKERIAQWHPFFAIFPRHVGGKNECRYLETIERRAITIDYCDGWWIDWEYRAIK